MAQPVYPADRVLAEELERWLAKNGQRSCVREGALCILGMEGDHVISIEMPPLPGIPAYHRSLRQALRFARIIEENQL